ncbi:MAG: superoxide dismutase family protein [Roseovarius sp.]
MQIHDGLRFSALVAGAVWLGASAAVAEDATAELQDTDGNMVGTVTLHEVPSGVLLHARLSGLPEGAHAFHVHETGECEPPFTSAGGHYDPEDAAHGIEAEDGPHAGDMPNIHVPASGELELEILNTFMEFDDRLFDDDGTSIVIHEGPDDYVTDPAGDAGARIACGVIRR